MIPLSRKRRSSGPLRSKGPWCRSSAPPAWRWSCSREVSRRGPPSWTRSRDGTRCDASALRARSCGCTAPLGLLMYNTVFSSFVKKSFGHKIFTFFQGDSKYPNSCMYVRFKTKKYWLAYFYRSGSSSIIHFYLCQNITDLLIKYKIFYV